MNKAQRYQAMWAAMACPYSISTVGVFVTLRGLVLLGYLNGM